MRYAYDVHMKCSHKKTVYVKEFVGYDWNGDEEYFDVPRQEDSFEDIDLHRYKCTRCGEVGYYSTPARMFYENNVNSPGIKGLTK